MLRYIIYLRQKNKPVFSLNQTKTLERTQIMSKGITLPDSDDRGDNKWEHASDNGKQIDHYTGEKGSVPDNHCHMFNEHGADGKSGVVHRGGCAVCDDNKSGGANTYGKIGDNEPSGGSSSGSDGGGSDGNTGNSGGK
jgi:hypothetical protein